MTICLGSYDVNAIGDAAKALHGKFASINNRIHIYIFPQNLCKMQVYK